MDPIDGLNIDCQEIVVGAKQTEKVAKRRRKKLGSKKLYRLMSCLKHKRHSHMLYDFKEDTDYYTFKVLFIHKRSRKWDPKYISLFEDMDSVSSKNFKKIDGKKYAEKCKIRFKSNITKLKDYIEEVEIVKLTKSKTEKKYRVLKTSLIAEMDKQEPEVIRMEQLEKVGCSGELNETPHYSCLSSDASKDVNKNNIEYINPGDSKELPHFIDTGEAPNLENLADELLVAADKPHMDMNNVFTILTPINTVCEITSVLKAKCDFQGENHMGNLRNPHMDMNNVFTILTPINTVCETTGVLQAKCDFQGENHMGNINNVLNDSFNGYKIDTNKFNRYVEFRDTVGKSYDEKMNIGRKDYDERMNIGGKGYDGRMNIGGKGYDGKMNIGGNGNDESINIGGKRYDVIMNIREKSSHETMNIDGKSYLEDNNSCSKIFNSENCENVINCGVGDQNLSSSCDLNYMYEVPMPLFDELESPTDGCHLKSDYDPNLCSTSKLQDSQDLDLSIYTGDLEDQWMDRWMDDYQSLPKIG